MKLYFYELNELSAEVETAAVEVEETRKFFRTSGEKFPFCYNKITRIDKSGENNVIYRDDSYVMFTTDNNKIDYFKEQLINQYQIKIDIFTRATQECERIIAQLKGEKDE